MKGTNLIIDFNNMAIRDMFSCVYTEVGVNTFDTQNECDILVRKLMTDITYIMRLFSPERTIIVCDAKDPWRRSLYGDIEGPGYKGTRTKDDTKNWTNINNAFDECKQFLGKAGIVVCELAHAEADDLAALWRNQVWSEGSNCILVSSDKDWTQLVGFNGKNYCLCFNPIATVVNKQKQKAIYYTKEYEEWANAPVTDPMALMFSTSLNASKDVITPATLKDNTIVRKEINPMAVLVEKIMCGDDGDNVPAFYQFYKNGKKTRVTEKRMEKILESINASTVSELSAHADDGSLIKALESCFKITIEDMDASERLDRQRRLVELNPELFPKKICSAFEFFVEDNKDNGYANSSTITMQDILRGTKYLQENFNKPKNNSIFDNIKGLEKHIPLAPSLPNGGQKSFLTEQPNALF